MLALKNTIGKLLLSCKNFEFFQKYGIHILHKHFYSPIPDTKKLKENKKLWKKESDLFGIDINEKKQLSLLENIFSQYKNECKFSINKTSIDYNYFINNGFFGLISAATLHCMIRHFSPKKIIEVGSGFSTFISAKAGLINQNNLKLISIEPYPNKVLQKGFPGLTKLIDKKVEDIDINFFEQLNENDILFIDSSHVIKINGDVTYLYLEILPRLKKGVIIHIHDIFFPYQYPKDWIINDRNFWTEQYLLQALLINNDAFEILWCGSYMFAKHLEKLKSVFTAPKKLDLNRNYFSSSFWMVKK